MKNLLIVLSAGMLFASCAPSTPEARIQQHPAKFDSLAEKQKSLVQKGQIARGMTTDAVYLAWGKPTETYEGSKDGKSTKRWDYTLSRPVYTTGMYGSYGLTTGYDRGPYGPYGRYGNPYGYGVGQEVAYLPYRVASVSFINDRVDSWEHAR